MRLDKIEIADLKVRLAEWQTPSAMRERYEETRNRIGPETMYNQGGLAFLRDAYVAAEFAKARKAEKVRLVSDRWPDFELLLDGRGEAFEAVEADRPGRRRGLEYRDDDGEVEEDSYEDWIARAEAAPTWIETACRRKADKYGARTNLVVYLNMNEFEVRYAEVVSSFPYATRAVKDAFNTVWVLWHARAHQVRYGSPLYCET